jgi:hypothetical protein
VAPDDTARLAPSVSTNDGGHAVKHWPRWTLYAVTSGSVMVVLSIAAWSAAWVVVA